MNWLDIILILVLAISTFIGLRKGVMAIVLLLVGLILGIILAGQHYGTVGGWLPIENPEYAKWAAYAIIIGAVLIVTVILACILRRFTRWAFLGWVDRLGGAILGLALGGLLCAAIVAACVKFGLGSGVVEGSGAAKLLLDWFLVVLALLPSEFDTVRGFFQ
ncbi:MAG: CvpA family protein [Dehalococcoidia bacterium]|nr:CvpA family protein [Dehalococcoidia bacterium]